MTSSETDASFSFDRRYMQRGKHSVMLVLPEPYHAHIGLIIAYWGNFEVIFDTCLEGLIAGELQDGKVRDTHDWRINGFKKRRKLFRNICTEWLESWNNSASSQLLQILDNASHLHSRRNLIAHGTYGYSILPHSSEVTDCHAFSHATGERMHFDENILKKLYHDISHVTAELIMVFKNIGNIDGQLFIIPDEEILRIYREATHPWNPNPKKRPDAV